MAVGIERARSQRHITIQKENIMARLSNTITKAIRIENKGKSASKEIKSILEAISGAVTSYGATTPKKAFKANKGLTYETVLGCTMLGSLTNADLVAVIMRQHRLIVQDTCQNGQGENFSLNAELARGIATDPLILGACYYLSNPSTGNGLL